MRAGEDIQILIIRLMILIRKVALYTTKLSRYWTSVTHRFTIAVKCLNKLILFLQLAIHGRYLGRKLCANLVVSCGFCTELEFEDVR